MITDRCKPYKALIGHNAIWRNAGKKGIARLLMAVGQRPLRSPGYTPQANLNPSQKAHRKMEVEAMNMSTNRTTLHVS